MKIRLQPFLLAFVFISFIPVHKKVTILLAGDSTMAIKEAKAFPETGWGMPFVYFWDSTVSVVNLARNGSSTSSFIREGLWNSIISQAKEGDYILIQFGHNDEVKEKIGRYTTPDSFKINLSRFIRESREKKAIPVLFSPVSRRRFDSSGKALETHDYSKYAREVARGQKVFFIDLDEKSRALYQQLGEDKSKMLFLQVKPGEHPNYPNGKEDNTHFNELGARLIAQLVLSELKALPVELVNHTVK